MPASRRAADASGNESPREHQEVEIEPFLPEGKVEHACLVVHEELRRLLLLKGERPFHSRPALRSSRVRPTTSDTGSGARSSSRNWGENAW